jgi:hypothetical protein
MVALRGMRTSLATRLVGELLSEWGIVMSEVLDLISDEALHDAFGRK